MSKQDLTPTRPCDHPAPVRERIALAHVDTIELFCFGWPDWLAPHGRDWFRRPVLKDGRFIGWRVVLQQPTKKAVRLWSRNQMRSRDGPRSRWLHLSRVDVAVDRMTGSEELARRLQSVLDRSLFLKWSNKLDGSQFEGTSYTRKPGSRRNLVFYSDHRSKLNGEPRCRAELRSRSQAARSAFGDNVIGVLNVDPRQLFQHYVRDLESVLLPAVPRRLSWPDTYI